MSVFRRGLMWVVMLLIVLLIGMSVLGAFIGADRAEAFFNSLPLAVYWIVFLLVFVLGFAGFLRLLKIPSLLLIHLGCTLILCGGLWGSHSAHDIRNQLFGGERFYKGQMQIYEGSQDDRVLIDIANEIKELPFTLRLNDFRIDYYQPGKLYAQTREGGLWQFDAEIGKEYEIGQMGTTVKVVKTFENFKLTVEDGEVTPEDVEGAESNPAVQLTLKSADGVEQTKYVFMMFPGHTKKDDEFLFSYDRAVKDYISDVDVLTDEQVVAAKSVEVNHPLHYGGYHFYQSSYQKTDDGSYVSIFSVTSDSGLNIVYAGYAMLCVGVFWQLWFKNFARRSKVAKGGADGN